MACILLWSSAVRPWFTCIQEDGCDKRAHQSYLGTRRNTPVIPNWFQPSQCCCCLCYLGEYLGLGTYWSLWQSEASVRLVLSLCWCHWCCLSSAWSSRHWSPCRRLWRLCLDAQLISPVLLPLLLSHRCHQQSGDWWLFCFSRCFKPSQPQRIISGLREIFIKRYTVKRTNKAVS